MAVLYIAAGVYHFVHPATYLKIMPVWLPWHYELVIISGACEILFALLLLFPPTRRVGAFCIIALLVAVFPANIQMTINYAQQHNKLLWLSILRLPLQIVLIWWAYRFTKPSRNNNLVAKTA
ncbi:MAG TPA: DoxX family protein [Segetibacter sp.]|jgi:uncharacterized membrane protein